MCPHSALILSVYRCPVSVRIYDAAALLPSRLIALCQCSRKALRWLSGCTLNVSVYRHPVSVRLFILPAPYPA